jgi:hypothetical protein
MLRRWADTFTNAQGKSDARLRVIFDNGTESNLLMGSLRRALNWPPHHRSRCRVEVAICPMTTLAIQLYADADIAPLMPNILIAPLLSSLVGPVRLV